MKKIKFKKDDRVKVSFKGGAVRLGTVMFYDKKWLDYAVEFDNGRQIMIPEPQMEAI